MKIEFENTTKVLSFNMPDLDLTILVATKYTGTLSLDHISV